MVFDGHSDLLYDVTRRRLAGEKRVLERHYFHALQSGGVEGMVLALWASAGDSTFWKQYPGGETDAARMKVMMDCARQELAEAASWLQLVRTVGEARQARGEGKRYAFLGVEGMASIGRDLRVIDRFAEFGVRLGMLTWNEENLLATGAGGDPHTGLTELGRQAVQRMQRRGMLVDVSHLNDGGFADIMRQTEGVVIASHSNCRKLCDVRRNLTDEQLRAIRDTGGVVGLNVHHSFVHKDPEKQTMEMLARHAAHMVEVMGVRHVACGFDFCEFFGPGNESVRGMEDWHGIPGFFRELERLGMNSFERDCIARENFLRVLS